jgi:hypothetical protein
MSYTTLWVAVGVVLWRLRSNKGDASTQIFEILEMQGGYREVTADADVRCVGKGRIWIQMASLMHELYHRLISSSRFHGHHHTAAERVSTDFGSRPREGGAM